MARLSKSKPHFKIFEDTGIPTPPADEKDPFDDSEILRRDSNASVNQRTPSKQQPNRHSTYLPSDADDDEDACPPDSLTSVSSFPESTSASQNDTDHVLPPASPQKFFTPQIIRPSFRRPESVRRMQMSSPRHSILSHLRSSRSGTPRSEYGRESPRIRRQIVEESSSEEGAVDESTHPLVLLHVTILPITLPWSIESMEELLPAPVMESLHLLRSKVSEMVQQRGILIPHPREEYEMLEERLLEALELKEERVTKCGHFRRRASQSSVESRGENDSGLGSDEDGEVCATCRHYVRCVASKKQKWSVKVFAANGLMRSPAWAAAWDGMESVDVEILPWIGEDDRRRLDRRREEEERERRFALEHEREEAGETTLLLQERKVDEEIEAAGREGALLAYEEAVVAAQTQPDRVLPEDSARKEGADDLPPIYRASQVPLSVLLRNYIFLLLQDRRIVGAFFAAILAIFFAMHSLARRSDLSAASMEMQPIDAAAVFEQYASIFEAQQVQDDGDVLDVLSSAPENVPKVVEQEYSSGPDSPPPSPRTDEVPEDSMQYDSRKSLEPELQADEPRGEADAREQARALNV